MKRALGAGKLPTKLYVFPLIDNKNSREQEKLENKKNLSIKHMSKYIYKIKLIK